MINHTTIRRGIAALAILAGILTVVIAATGGFTLPLAGGVVVYADTVTFGLRLVLLFAAIYTFTDPSIVNTARKWFRGESPADETVAKRATIYFLGGLVLLGCALRIATLAPFLINPDEAMFVHTAQASDIPGVVSISRFHGHPPSNYVLLHIMLKISSEIAWLRLPALLTGLALIPLVYITANRVLGATAAIAMAIMVTLSPGLIELSAVCRNYAPLFVCIILALYFLVRFIQEERWNCLIYSACWQLLAVTFHYNFIILLIALHGSLILVYIYQKRPFRAWLITSYMHLPVMVAVALLYLWHIRYFSGMRAESYADSWMSPQFDAGPIRTLLNLRDLFGTLLSEELAIPGLLLGMLGVYTLAKKRAWGLLLFMLSPFAVAYAFVVAGKMPFGGTRHTLYIFPFALGLVAVGAAALASLWKKQVTRIVLAIATVAMLGNTVYINISLGDYQELAVLKKEFREALTILDERVEPNDIVMFDQQSALVLSYHVPELEPWDWGDDPYIFHRTDQDWNWYYWPEPTSGWYFKPKTFANSALRLAEHYNLENVGRVWTIHLGWEEQSKLRRRTERDHESIALVDTGFVASSRSGSRPLLFAMEWPEVLALAQAEGVPPLGTRRNAE